MRLWSISPTYLDTKGLLAVWREGLLAQEVLKGNTKGYINHPQLDRFRMSTNPLGFIGAYLVTIWTEAFERGYKFDESKIFRPNVCKKLTVTSGQLEYEFKHLQNKLFDRDFVKYTKNNHVILLYDEYSNPEYYQIEANPLFEIVDGNIESWEKIR